MRLSAVWLPALRSIAQPAMEVFVGIPSIVYGWLGITVLVPFLRELATSAP